MKLLNGLLAASILVSPALQAQPFPRGCEVTGFSFHDSYLVVNESGKQAFYMLRNRSDSTVELQRYETRQVFMSPPLQAILAPENWAAFASDVQNQYFQCFKKDEENTQMVNCQDVIDICQYPRARFALSNMGNYWVSANKSLSETIRDSVGQGIYLKW